MPNFFITTPSVSPEKNFSFRDVLNARTYLIPIEQQMVVYQEFSVQDEGELDLEGELVILD